MRSTIFSCKSSDERGSENVRRKVKARCFRASVAAIKYLPSQTFYYAPGELTKSLLTRLLTNTFANLQWSDAITWIIIETTKWPNDFNINLYGEDCKYYFWYVCRDAKKFVRHCFKVKRLKAKSNAKWLSVWPQHQSSV